MIDPRNNGNLTGGLVADPELVGKNGDVLRLRIAASNAGKDQSDPDNRTGYFNVTMFLSDDNWNTKFVRDQLNAGNLKKGSQVQITYRLQQDRWEKDGTRAQNVGLIAEALTYSGSKSSGDSESSSSAGSSETISEF